MHACPMSRLLSFIFLLTCFAAPALAGECGGPAAVCVHGDRDFPIISKGEPVPVIADGKLEPGAMRAVRGFQSDLSKVAGEQRELLERPTKVPDAVIIGTLGRSRIIDSLVRKKRLNASGVRGRSEAYLQQVIERPT